MRSTWAIILIIAAMTGCSTSDERGATEVKIDGATDKAAIRFDLGQVDKERLEQALRDCGVPSDVVVHSKKRVLVGPDNAEHDNWMTMTLRLAREEGGYSLRYSHREGDTPAILFMEDDLNAFFDRAAEEVATMANFSGGALASFQ